MCRALVQFSSVHSLSHVQLFVTPWTTAHQAFLSFTISPGQPVAMVRAGSSLLHTTPGWRTSPRVASSSRGAGEPFSPGCPPTSLGSSQRLQQGLCPGPGRDIGWHVDQHPALVKVYTLKRATSGTTRVPSMSSGYMKQLKGISLLVRA